MNKNSPGVKTNTQARVPVATDQPPPKFHPPAWLQINQFAVAVGLLWQPIRNDISLQQQARLASGNRHNLDLYRMATNSKQVGFASSKEGYSPNMLAGANQFDQAIPVDSWLAAFKLTEDSDDWWIVAKRYGAIYQDKIFTTRRGARDEFSTLIIAPDWERIIAPEDWEIPDAQVLSYVNALTLNPNMGLKPLHRNRRWWVYFPTLLIIISLTLFLGNYLSNKLEYSEDYQDNSETLHSEQVIAKPWTGKGRIGEFTSVCLALMEELFFLSPGWQLMSMICSQDNSRYSVSATINREPTGSTGYLRQLAFQQAGVEVRIGCNGDCANAQLGRTVPDAPTRENELPWQANKVDEILRERFQTLHADLSLHHRGPRTLSQDSTPPRAYSSRHDFSIRTKICVDEYADLLKDIPGIVPETLVYTPANNSWLLTAKIFHAIVPGQTPDMNKI